MSGDAVFIIVSIVLIALYTAWNIRWMRRRHRLIQEILRQAKEADAAKEPESNEL